MARVKKILLTLAVPGLLLGAGSLIFIWYIGAWNIIFPSHRHETVAPAIPATVRKPAILLFTKTNGFRHHGGIEAGVRLIGEIAERRGWSVFHTENSATFNSRDLQRFNLVMFHNVSGDVLSDRQQQNFQGWLTGGGGWVGTHAAGDGSHRDWPWYVENLIGAEFTAHIMGPQFQVAAVTTEAVDHAATAGLPTHWSHEEEWYSWWQSPRPQGFTVLATIDEDSYTPVANFAGTVTDLRMGDHPVVWSRCIAAGRSLYSALGHAAAAYEVPEHRRLLENALAWAMDAEVCAGKAR